MIEIKKKISICILVICIVYFIVLIYLNIYISSSATNGRIFSLKDGQEYCLSDSELKNVVNILCPIIGLPQIHHLKDVSDISLKWGKVYIEILPNSKMVCINGVYFRINEKKIKEMEKIIEENGKKNNEYKTW